ncbi:MAG: hypothetical protein GY901_10290 [Actinomycetia bacterium]|nr:hypothetical protein [Actinomycetes bacterium]
MSTPNDYYSNDLEGAAGHAAELIGAEFVTLERVHVLLPLLRVLAMAQRVTA